MKRLSSLLLITLVSSTVIYNLTPTGVYSEPLLVQANPTQNSATLQQRAEGLILLLSKKNFVQARKKLAPGLQSLWPPEKIKDEWEGDILKVQGDFKKILKSKVVNIVDGDLVIVSVQFSRNVADLTVTFNAEGQLVGLDFPETMSIEQIAQTFVESLSKKDYGLARHYLSPYLKTEFFPDKVQKKWEALEKRVGVYQKRLGMEIKPMSGDQTLVIVKIQFAKVTQDLFLTFDQQKKIVNVDIPES